MTKSAFGAGLLGTLLAAMAAGGAEAQQVSGFSLQNDPLRVTDDRSLRPIRLDPMRFREDAFGEPYDLFGMPLTGERPLAREKGFSVGVRPGKGLRAVAKLRF